MAHFGIMDELKRREEDIGDGSTSVSIETQGTRDARTVDCLPQTVAKVEWSQPEPMQQAVDGRTGEVVCLSHLEPRRL